MVKPKQEDSSIDESQSILRKTTRELSLKTNFSSRKIKEQYEMFKRHFPAGTIARDDIEEAILTVLPENYCHTIR